MFCKKLFSEIEFEDLRANSVDPDEVAHYEPPYPDLYCLQVELFSFFGSLSVKVYEYTSKGDHSLHISPVHNSGSDPP